MLVEQISEFLYQFNVLPLAAAADVVNLARAPLTQDEFERAAVVLNVEPVAHVLSIAVNRQRLGVERIDDHQGDEFLWKLIGTVIVRWARNHDRQAESAMVSERQQISAGFAR